MTRSVSTSIALFCALSFFASFVSFGCGGPSGNTNTALTSPAPSATVDCNTAGHDAILKAVYDAITNNKTYGPQEWQFNITENSKKLTIIGWSTDWNAIVKLVGDTAVGCTVDASNFVAKSSDLGQNFRLIRACPAGYAPCGDVCIPVGDYCQVNLGPATPSYYTCTSSGTPAPSPSPGSSPGPAVNKPK